MSLVRRSSASIAARRFTTTVAVTTPASPRTLAVCIASAASCRFWSSSSSSSSSSSILGQPRLPKMSTPSNRSAQIASHLASSPSSMSTNSPCTPAPGLPTPHQGGGLTGSEAKVLTSTRGTVYEIILNRQTAINALDSDMVSGIRGAIDRAGRDPHFSLVLLRAGDQSRGLCSGGDVLKVVNLAAGESNEAKAAALNFFKEEYCLDWLLAKLGEEVSTGESRKARSLVAVMDGITMGGGVGLSVHAPFRIATERTMFAMPETGIGFFPDVGVSRVLARLDGRIGTYLGMTGDRISGQEAYAIGLATHYVHSATLEQLYDSFSTLPAGATPDQIASLIDDISVDPFNTASSTSTKNPLDASPLIGSVRTVLDYIFNLSTCEEIFEALEDLSQATSVEEVNSSFTGREIANHLRLPTLDETLAGEVVRSWAARTLTTLTAKSPRSLKVTHYLINYKAKHHSIDESFRNDMRLATVFCDLWVGQDFYRGVRHVLTKDPVTKERRTGRARWFPSDLERVDDTLTRDLFFSSLKTAQTMGGLKLTPPELDVIPAHKPLNRSARLEKEDEMRGLGPLGWQVHFNEFHPLPSEAELEALLQGSHPVSGSLQIELQGREEDVVKEIAGMIRGTRRRRGLNCLGVEWKVKEWRRRRLALHEEE